MKYAPQLADTCKDPSKYWGDARYGMEPKFDGVRILAERWTDGDHVLYYTRNDKLHHGEKYRAINEELEKIFPEGTILDGEFLVVRDGEIAHDCGEVTGYLNRKDPDGDVEHRLIYIVFDLLMLDGHDARAFSFAERRKLLERAFDGVKTSRVSLTLQVEPDESVYDSFLERGYEGVMIKRLDAPYASGKRGYGLFKVKPQDDDEVVIMGYKAGQGSFSGMVGAIVFGQYKDGVLTERGTCSGMDMKIRKQLTEWLINGNKCVDCYEVITIKHHGITKHDNFRHPQFKTFRPDRDADEIIWTTQ